MTLEIATAPTAAAGSAEVAGGTAGQTGHVLFIVDQLAQLGGGERVLLRLASGLQASGWRVTVLTLKSGLHPDAAAWRAAGGELLVWPLRRSYDLNAWRLGARLRRLICAESVTVVQTFFETSDLWAGVHVGRLLPRRRRPRLISSRRDMGILRARKHDVLYRLVNPAFDSVVAVSEAVRVAVLAREHLAPEKVVVIPNGLDLSRAEGPETRSELRAALQASSGVPATGPLLVAVGNLRRVKGMDLILRAAALVFARFPEAQLAIAGAEAEPGCGGDLRRLAAELGVAGHVHFLGSVADVFPLLRAASLFFLLSRSEGMPNCLLEAMACGIPCVATRVGGTPEVLSDGEEGFLVASEDFAAAAERGIRILSDPALARRFSEAARAHAGAEFSRRGMVAATGRLYAASKA